MPSSSDAGIWSIAETEQFLATERPAIVDAIGMTLDSVESDPLLDSLMRAYPSRPAKHLRPALCLATCRAFGGQDADVMPSAIAIELMHNLFLVHDDITDVSETRRGLPTLYAEEGVPLALTATGGLGVVAYAQLHRNYPRLGSVLSARVADEFLKMLMQTLRGQARELRWIRDGVTALAPHDYLEMVVNKTCWYTTIHPMRVGAIVGSWGSVDPDRFIEFGVFLGAAFQVQDDLLNLAGDEATYGKESLGDLREAKRTLMLIHLLGAADPADRSTVDRYLALDESERSHDVVLEILGLMTKYGSLDWARTYASQWADIAAVAFEAAFDGVEDSHDLDFIRSLTPYMIGRDR